MVKLKHSGTTKPQTCELNQHSDRPDDLGFLQDSRIAKALTFEKPLQLVQTGLQKLREEEGDPTVIIVVVVVVALIATAVGIIIYCCTKEPANDDDTDFETSDSDAAISNIDPEIPGYVETKPPKIDKQQVMESDLTLANVCTITHRAIMMLEEQSGKDVIVAIGDTGSGKSTLLTALVFGVDDLKEETINKKKVISAKTERTEFKIGHSIAKSETFIPHFYYDPDSKVVFTDIAGLNDSSGDLVDIINRLITKCIFKQSKTVKFIIAVTHVSMQESRGKNVREQFQTVQSICYGVDLKHMLKSIKPVITKCRPKDKELDVEFLRNDLYEQLTKDVKTQRNQDDVLRNGTDEEKEAREAYFTDLEQFYEELPDKFDIVDPMDRYFEPPEDAEEQVNQAMTIEKLKDQLIDLDSIDGDQLNAPLSPAIMAKVNQLFVAEDQKCHKILKEYIDEAKRNKDFKKDISKEDQFKKYKSSLQFLRKYQLLADANQRYNNFKNYTIYCQEMIERAKSFSQLDQQLQDLFLKIEDMYEHQTNMDYEKLVSTMTELDNMVRTARQSQNAAKNIEDSAKIGLIIQQARRGMENTVMDISTNKMNLCAFGFELRKADSENKYTNEFLNGQVRPDILARIIMQNQFQDEEMKPDKAYRFCLGGSSLPLGSINKKLAYVDDDIKDYQIKIKLTPTGFMFINPAGDCLTAANSVQQGVSSKVGWQPITAPNEQNTWLLQPKQKNSDEPYFWIQHGYGDQAPRLVSINKGSKSQLKVTCDQKDGYMEEDRALWKVYLVNM